MTQAGSLIIGAGGHYQGLMNLRRQSSEIIGVTDVDPKKLAAVSLEFPFGR